MIMIMTETAYSIMTMQLHLSHCTSHHYL